MTAQEIAKMLLSKRVSDAELAVYIRGAREKATHAASQVITFIEYNDPSRRITYYRGEVRKYYELDEILNKEYERRMIEKDIKAERRSEKAEKARKKRRS